MKNFVKSILIITTLISFGGCGNSGQKERNLINEAISSDSLNPYLQNNIEYLLPSPDELYDIIFKEKLKYNPNLILGSIHESKAINSNYQALLLGVYLADFSYSLIYLDYSTSNKIFENIKSLSEKIGISDGFNNYYQRVDDFLVNMDSIESIYNDFSKNSFSSLAESSNYEVLSLVAMGVYVESIYIGFQIHSIQSLSSAVKSFFIEQRMIFENFYLNYLSYNKDKEDLKKFNENLNSLYSLFRLNIWLVVDKSELNKNTKEDSNKVSYLIKTKTDNLKSLGQEIVVLRNNLVNNEY